MRIRKRSMLPFSLFSPSRMPSDLLYLRGARAEEVEKGRKEQGQAGGEVVLREAAGGGGRKGGPDRRIDRGGGLAECPFDGVSDGIGGECNGEEDGCMLAAPIEGSVEASGDAQEERWGAREKGNSGRNEKMAPPPDAETSTAKGRCEERDEKVIPLKKRKGGLEWGGEATPVEKQNKMKSKVKKAAKRRNQEPVENAGAAVAGASATSATNAKKGRRGGGGVLMEGSRCSRINGRGWRCCQQTLVGYSLCEHHLGKGRLRSMNSLPTRASAAAKPEADTPAENEGSVSSSADRDVVQESEAKSAARKKIGMVKARSISSLLALATTAALSADSDSTTAAPADSPGTGA